MLVRTRENLESQVTSISDLAFNLWSLLNFCRLATEKDRFFFNFAPKWILLSGSTRKRKSFSDRFSCEMKVNLSLFRGDVDTRTENDHSGHKFWGLTDYPDSHSRQLRPIQEIDVSNHGRNPDRSNGFSFPHLFLQIFILSIETFIIQKSEMTLKKKMFESFNFGCSMEIILLLLELFRNKIVFRNNSFIPEQVTYSGTSHLFRDKSVIPGQVTYSGTSLLFRDKSRIPEQNLFRNKWLVPEFARLFLKRPPSRITDPWEIIAD
jgi:hypothetical protein